VQSKRLASASADRAVRLATMSAESVPDPLSLLDWRRRIGEGRYVLDTVKGADLGMEDGRVVLDFNLRLFPVLCLRAPMDLSAGPARESTLGAGACR
jgi:hypothetical protein